MAYEFDAVVALAGGFSQESGLGKSTQAHMDTTIELMKHSVARRLIVSGSHSFLEKTPTHGPLAKLMKDYPQINGIDDVLVEGSSLDTVGNALFTKIDYTEPNNWSRLAVVTNEFHVPRAEHIFKHVMGPDYDIESFSAPNEDDFRIKKTYEFLAGLLTKSILAGTQPGDTEAIMNRLFTIVPGYAEVPIPKRLGALAAGIFAK